jgi:hypothetical protein
MGSNIKWQGWIPMEFKNSAGGRQKMAPFLDFKFFSNSIS